MWSALNTYFLIFFILQVNAQKCVNLETDLKNSTSLDSISFNIAKKNVFFGESHKYKYTDCLALSVFNELQVKQKTKI